MSNEVANLLAAKFIARSDMKAIQRRNGEYNPVQEKFTRQDLLNHLNGYVTYGHYLLNQDNQCKLFAFDIDFEQTNKVTGWSPLLPTEVDADGWWTNFQPMNAREVWLDRSAVIQRNYMKYRLRVVAGKLVRIIHDLLELPAAVTYTGAKGLHVYGFTGLVDAKIAREAADIVIAQYGALVKYKGNHFFKHGLVADDQGKIDPYETMDFMSIEVFPKQVDLTNKTHGNLMRLPLGVNLKNPKDPTFFIDLRGNFGEQGFMLRDPVDALTVGDQFAGKL